MVKKIKSICWQVLIGIGIFGTLQTMQTINKTLINENKKPVIKKLEQEKTNLENKLERELKAKLKDKSTSIIHNKPEVIPFSKVKQAYLKAILQMENAGNPNASRYEKHLDDTSYGEYQILTSTAKWLKRKFPDLPDLGQDIKSIKRSLCNPEINKAYAERFLRYLYSLYKDPRLVGAAYNSGPKRPLIARIQEQLSILLHLNLEIDGLIGKKTRKAIKIFQTKYKLKNNGRLDSETYHLIQKIWKERYPTEKNPLGTVPHIPKITDYANRFNNLVNFYLSLKNK